jgi:hypothetical protein
LFPLVCGTDQDCKDGEVCRLGYCWPGCGQGGECPTGFQCLAGACFKSCQQDGECDSGYVCRQGTCQPAERPDGGPDGATQDGQTDADGSGGDLGDGFPICGTFQIEASSVPPNMLLVVDKSGSMRDPTSSGSPRTKMQDLKDAVGLLLTQGQGSIRFGWMAYPNDDSCAAGRVSVQIGDDTVAAIQTRLAALTPGGGTPTGPSLTAADTYLVNLNDTLHRSFVVLITDGMPTCPNGNGRQENEQDNQLSREAVTALRSHGFDTFVIGLGADLNVSNPALLNDMAVAGGWPRDGTTKYYQADSLEQLNQVLTDIGGKVIGCNMLLDQLPEYPNYLWVFFDEVPIPRDRDHRLGWDYDPNRNTIDFYGSFCDELRSGSVTKVDVLMGCRPPD